MSEIEITGVTATDTELRTEIDYTSDLRRFFGDDTLTVAYDVDVSAVPEAVLTIPALAHVFPLALATGADVRVPTVDERYLDTLERIGETFREMYPSLMESCRLLVDSVARPDVRETATETGSDAAMLFTGGVDSLSTYARNRDEDPALINVQGWVISMDEEARWRRNRATIEAYGRRFGVPTQFVRSNMLSLLDWRMLIAHFNHYHDGGWYSAIGCGLGLTGLCAPLAAAEGYRRLYLAATIWESVRVPAVVDHWEGRGMPWGSHPLIVDEIGWAGTEAVHDGFELTRQDRVNVIAEFVRETGHDDLVIHSCNDESSVDNCNDCEKCFRTAFGLALAGRDPSDHGFELRPADFEWAREGIESGEWLEKEEQIFWEDLQTQPPPEAYPVDGAAEFLAWLEGVDIGAIDDETAPPLTQRAARTALRNVPYPAYSGVAALYETFAGRSD